MHVKDINWSMEQFKEYNSIINVVSEIYRYSTKKKIYCHRSNILNNSSTTNNKYWLKANLREGYKNTAS